MSIHMKFSDTISLIVNYHSQLTQYSSTETSELNKYAYQTLCTPAIDVRTNRCIISWIALSLW